MPSSYLADSSLVIPQLQHEVLVVVEPLPHRFQLLLAQAVQREQVVLSLKQPVENLHQPDKTRFT